MMLHINRYMYFSKAKTPFKNCLKNPSYVANLAEYRRNWPLQVKVWVQR